MLDAISTLTSIASAYGYEGMLAVALVGSLVPFLPVPFEVAIVVLSGTLDPLLVGIAAGLGGALGKVTSYVLGHSGYRLSTNKTRRNLDVLHEFAGRYGDLAVFVFAATPLPDDICYVPIGMLRFPFWRFFLADAAGKVTLYIGIAYFGRLYLGLLNSLIGNTWVSLFSVVAVTAFVSLLLARVDWGYVATLAKERGLSGVIEELPSILRRSKD